mmetsp:Transcript_68880/g.151836  ORF Transcript_68880/g.151836 Transcript_68880/m.151836 type:complete len:229 (-) Transcript_68880:112-798(-)
MTLRESTPSAIRTFKRPWHTARTSRRTPWCSEPKTKAQRRGSCGTSSKNLASCTMAAMVSTPESLSSWSIATKSPWIKGTWKTWPAETLMDRGDKASQQSEDRRIAVAPKAAATFTMVPTLEASVSPSSATSRSDGVTLFTSRARSTRSMGRRAKANAKVLDLAKGTEMPVTASIMASSQTSSRGFCGFPSSNSSSSGSMCLCSSTSLQVKRSLVSSIWMASRPSTSS